jgi:hypothetical protein
MDFEKQKIRISLTGATISKSERNDHGYCLFRKNYQYVTGFVGISHFSFDTILKKIVWAREYRKNRAF